MKFPSTALMAAFLSLPIRPDSTADPSGAPDPGIEQRIERVRDGLLPPVLVEGQPVERTTLAARMAALRVPGVGIAVIHHGRIDWARGFGQAKIGGAPVAADTLFQAGSISKVVAAFGVLCLSQEGRLDLDADVDRYLAGWKIPDSAFTGREMVTLRRLLGHCAGVSGAAFGGYSTKAPIPTVQEILEGSPPAKSPPVVVDHLPGEAWQYSDGGYLVIQKAVADSTGTSFSRLMQDVVLGPLGMDHSTYFQPLPPERLGEAATPYLGLHRSAPEALPGGPLVFPETAAKGLWTTPTDLARFAVELQASLSGHGRRLLSAASAMEMLTPGLGDQGLGPEIGGTPARRFFSEEGANLGYRCEMVAYLDGEGAVVMTNSDSGDPLVDQVLASVATEYGWPDFAPPVRTVVPIDPASLGEFVGRYRLEAVRVCLIFRQNGQLFIRIAHQKSFRLLPMAARKFFITAVDATVAFDASVKGRAPRLVIHQDGRDFPADRLE